MPYRRQYRKRVYKRKPVSKMGTALSLARTAYRGFKFIRGIVNSEKHVHDFESTAAIDSTGEVHRLTGVAQGDDLTGRTGRSIMVKSLQIRARMTINASATTSQVRCILLIDHDANSTAPTWAEVIGSSDLLTGMRELDTDRKRFRVLYDKLFSVSINGNRTAIIDKFIKLGNHHVYFDGTTNTSDASGKIFLLLVSNEGTNTVAKVLNTRIRFYDN